MFQRGSLQKRIAQATAAALHAGALQPLPTDVEFLEAGGLRFLVRVVSNLARKDQQRRAAGERLDGQRNPFLPYDPMMYVADASDTHVCLLNKFNVLDHHLLIVTREFEPQETPLNQTDFGALWNCLGEYDGLAFYNAGVEAGASQPHKHLQLVPLPLAAEGPAVPLEAMFEKAGARREFGVIHEIEDLPFAHGLVRLDPRVAENVAAAADATLSSYQSMLHTLNLATDPARPEFFTRPYNLLITQRWMLVVPRRQESVASMALNALAFAGALLVRDREQLEKLRQLGPWEALTQAAWPRV